MKVVFRTDSSLVIGSGHVMRCLTLADELRQRGANVTFVCREFTGNLIGLIEGKGYAVECLQQPEDACVEVFDDVAHAAWLGVSWQQDATETIKALGMKRATWLIIDHYSLDSRWEQELRPHVGKIMVIDDLADRQHDCDLLLDQNHGRVVKDYSQLVPSPCVILTGSNYALLRQEFAQLRDYSLQRRVMPQLRRLLITMGGVDNPNATSQVLDILKACPLPEDCNITVVMGPHAPWLKEVQLLAEQMPWPTEVQLNVVNMAQLMADSDLAIGAAGSTSWERCCLGLPSIVLVTAENQIPIARALLEAGAADSPICIENGHSRKDWELLIGRLTSDRLKELTIKSSQLCNGDGTKRVAEHI